MSRTLVSLTMLLMLCAGCVARPWRPPPPKGDGWAYEGRGSFTQSTSVSAGRIGGFHYAFGYHRAGHKGGPTIGYADRLWRKRNARTHRFNSSLGAEGERVIPGAECPQVVAQPAAEPPGQSPSASPAPSNEQPVPKDAERGGSK